MAFSPASGSTIGIHLPSKQTDEPALLCVAVDPQGRRLGVDGSSRRLAVWHSLHHTKAKQAPDRLDLFERHPLLMDVWVCAIPIARNARGNRSLVYQIVAEDGTLIETIDEGLPVTIALSLLPDGRKSIKSRSPQDLSIPIRPTPRPAAQALEVAELHVTEPAEPSECV